jgi:CBS domain-containing protein
MITQPVGAVLKGKENRDLLTVPATAMVAEAVALMSKRSAGSVVIKDAKGAVEGIFTERDLMKRVVDEGRDAKSTPIGAVMSCTVRRVPSTASVEEALRLMVQHGYRHLLVEDESTVLGLVSIRDLMSWIVLPDKPIAHEGRPGVVKARTEEAIRSLKGQPH